MALKLCGVLAGVASRRAGERAETEIERPSLLVEQLAVNELSAQINAFLAELSRDDRVMFVKRYWFAETITEIADGFGISESNASVRLSRIRGRLRKYLKSKEVYI